jgi:hypothetical protein
LIRAAGHPFTLTLTARQAEALRALAALDELPPEVYAAEVLTKHLYHAYTPEVARRAAELGPTDPDPDTATDR